VVFRAENAISGLKMTFRALQASKSGCEASKSTFVKKWYFELKTLFHASK